MKKLFGSLAILVAVGGLHAATLVEKGTGAYSIVIRPGAPRTTRAAAADLREYVKKVTGADLPVVEAKPSGKKALYIGGHADLPKTTEFDPAKYLNTERFRIAELPSGDLSIMGADCDSAPYTNGRGDFGLLFGVYEFMERFLGVRWYAPGVFGECFEEKSTVKVEGLPLEVTPRAWCRSIWPSTWNEFANADALKFVRHLRSPGLQDGGANHSMMDLRFFAPDQDEIFALEADGKTRNRGLLKAGTNPEARQWQRYPQYCFSNPATVKAYCDFIDAVYSRSPRGLLWRDRAPNDYAVYVVPDDNYTTQPCYCANCQKQINRNGGRAAMSPLVWGFVKKVAEYVKTKYPDKKVLSLAYEAYYLPPNFDLPDNVVVQICVNPYLIYHGAKPFRDSFDHVLKLWEDKVSTISLWHYIMPYDDIPYSMPHIMYQWFRDYPKVKAVFLELNDTGLRAANLPAAEKRKARTVNDHAQSHLNLYFAQKSLAGCELNVDTELELYYRLFYGPAAVPMKRFYETLHQAWEHVPAGCADASGSYPKFSGKALYEDIYPAAVLQKLEAALAEARKLAPEGSLYRRRIDWIENGYFAKFRTSAAAFAAELKRTRDESLPPPAANAPALDGKLDGEFWSGLEDHKFVRIDAPLPPNFGTTFKMGIADGKLWLGIRAEDPDSHSQIVTGTHHDADVYNDDSIEIFIRPGNRNAKKFKNISVNLNAITLDYSAGDGTKLDKNYESGAMAKVIRGNGFYTMTVAIPLEKLDLKPGDEFALNVCRNKRSGVGERHERSAWYCPSGSFWNLNGAPQVRLPGVGDQTLEDFSKHPYVGTLIRTMPNDKLGPTTKKGVRHELKNNVLSLFFTFNSDNHRYDYGVWSMVLKKGPVKLNGATGIELRFRNPDAGLNHTATYSYVDASGKTRGDYIRFCRAESYPEWRVRQFDIAQDGYNAQCRTKKGIVNPPAVELKGFQIYSTGKLDGVERRFDLDYVRLVTPAAR